MAQSFQISLVREDGTIMVVLCGELDLYSANVASQAVGALAGDAGQVIVLDLAELSFLDAAGVRPLVRLVNATVDAGSRVVALYAKPMAAVVIEMTQIELVDPQLPGPYG